MCQILNIHNLPSTLPCILQWSVALASACPAGSRVPVGNYAHYVKGIHDKILSNAGTRILSLSRIGSCKIIIFYAGLWPQSCLTQDQNLVEQQYFLLLSPVILSFPGGIFHVGGKIM